MAGRGAAAPAFQMSPPKQRINAAPNVVAPVVRKLAPSVAAAPTLPLADRAANGQNFSKKSNSPALRKVSESLDKLRSELHLVRAQKEMTEQTTKIERVELAETRRVVQDFSDDEHDVAVDVTERIDQNELDEAEDDDDDIVVSLPTVAPKTPVAPKTSTIAAAPKTPSAADMRARVRAIDAANVIKSPAATIAAPVQLSLEQRVAALERELAEEREARRALERKIAHLLK